MKNTFSVLFYVKKQQKKSGLLPIMGRITVNKQTTQFFTQLEIDPQTTEWDSKTKKIIKNATIVGMKPMDDQSVVKDLSAFRPGLVVADAVYNPEETKLLREAKEAGCTCIGGKGMLLWQGVAAFKLYTGQDMPVEDVKKLFFS